MLARIRYCNNYVGFCNSECCVLEIFDRDTEEWELSLLQPIKEDYTINCEFLRNLQLLSELGYKIIYENF